MSKKLNKIIKITEKQKSTSTKTYKIIPNINDEKYYNQKVIFLTEILIFVMIIKIQFLRHQNVWNLLCLKRMTHMIYL